MTGLSGHPVSLWPHWASTKYNVTFLNLDCFGFNGQLLYWTLLCVCLHMIGQENLIFCVDRQNNLWGYFFFHFPTFCLATSFAIIDNVTAMKRYQFSSKDLFTLLQYKLWIDFCIESLVQFQTFFNHLISCCWTVSRLKRRKALHENCIFDGMLACTWQRAVQRDSNIDQV